MMINSTMWVIYPDKKQQKSTNLNSNAVILEIYASVSKSKDTKLLFLAGTSTQEVVTASIDDLRQEESVKQTHFFNRRD